MKDLKKEIARTGYFTDNSGQRLSGGMVTLQMHLPEGCVPLFIDGTPAKDAVNQSFRLDEKGEPQAGECVYDPNSFKGNGYSYTVTTYNKEGKKEKRVEWCGIVSGSDGIDFAATDFSKIRDRVLAMYGSAFGFIAHPPPPPAPEPKGRVITVAEVDAEKEERRKSRMLGKELFHYRIASSTSDPPAQYAFCDGYGERLSGGSIAIYGSGANCCIMLDKEGIPKPGQTLQYEDVEPRFVVAIHNARHDRICGPVGGCEIDTTKVTNGVFDLAAFMHPRQLFMPNLASAKPAPKESALVGA